MSATKTSRTFIPTPEEVEQRAAEARAWYAATTSRSARLKERKKFEDAKRFIRESDTEADANDEVDTPDEFDMWAERQKILKQAEQRRELVAERRARQREVVVNVIGVRTQQRFGQLQLQGQPFRLCLDDGQRVIHGVFHCHRCRRKSALPMSVIRGAVNCGCKPVNTEAAELQTKSRQLAIQSAEALHEAGDIKGAVAALQSVIRETMVNLFKEITGKEPTNPGDAVATYRELRLCQAMPKNIAAKQLLPQIMGKRASRKFAELLRFAKEVSTAAEWSLVRFDRGEPVLPPTSFNGPRGNRRANRRRA